MYLRIWHTKLSYHAIASRLKTKHRWQTVGIGATGTYVLGLPTSDRVLKIGDDRGLAVFIQHLGSVKTDPALPKLYAVIQGNFNGASWHGIWCERLDPLSLSLTTCWVNWIKTDWLAHRGSPVADPFNITKTLNVLSAAAIAGGVDLDVLKSDNVMMRHKSPQLVFSDPLN